MTSTDAADSSDTLANVYLKTRSFTDRITRTLSAEDCMVQSMDDASPTRWHLAHTTWFFETFVLKDQPDYRVFDEAFGYLFNSYYNTIGDQYPRHRRGLISRPGLETIREYRSHVDRAIRDAFDSNSLTNAQLALVQTGIQHEQQHQELILTDIKHALSCSPLWPKYDDLPFEPARTATENWIDVPSGLVTIGQQGEGFSFDNESPVHEVHLMGTRLAGDLVTCGEYREFIDDGGYERPELWLSMGWNAVQTNGWRSPLYWLQQNGAWLTFTLAGLVPLNDDWPVCHISLFEADAYARWRGMRLPTEFEWEAAAKSERNRSATRNEQPFADQLVDRGFAIHPTRSPDTLMGSVWQWTSSSYAAYPGYRPPPGAVGEYNGKFMCNQYVLRGGSVATSSDHIRTTYRNFFPADTRWQFTGIRLAK
ncbi:ergothioneine biosynthesis protein EgtB [Neorhodopirellula pilleata]|nr:ergothioneine biosynthesis protein EgtB [Neorhodopirellula pilleata]